MSESYQVVSENPKWRWWKILNKRFIVERYRVAYRLPYVTAWEQY